MCRSLIFSMPIRAGISMRWKKQFLEVSAAFSRNLEKTSRQVTKALLTGFNRSTIGLALLLCLTLAQVSRLQMMIIFV